MVVYTVLEKVWWVERRNEGLSFENVCDAFVETFPQRPRPNQTTVMRTYARFRETGSVAYQRRGVSLPRAHEPEGDVVTLAALATNSRMSVRAGALMTGIPRETVRRTIKKYGYRSYKDNLHQRLEAGDKERRMQFASAIIEKEDEEPGFTSRIIFTDEKTFTLNHSPNHQNHRAWAEENPHIVFTANTQYRNSLNVWAGMVNDCIVGPIVLDGTLTGERYLHLLQGEISDRINDLPLPEELWFMHDGCPAHNYGPATAYLRDAFPDHVIGTHETLAWPARSPDMNPCDYFLWPSASSAVYHHAIPFPDVPALQNRLHAFLETVTPAQLLAVKDNFLERMEYCVAAEGGLFEHLIR